MNRETEEFSTWLEQKYLQWQIKQGTRATLGQFADMLGVSRAVLSHYMNGIRKPRGGNVHRIATQLGPEVYDVLGLQRPDPQLQFITRYWHKLQPEVRENIVNQVEKFIQENEAGSNNDASPGSSNLPV